MLVVATIIELAFEGLVIRQLSAQRFWTLFSAIMILVISGYALAFAHRWKLGVFIDEWEEKYQPLNRLCPIEAVADPLFFSLIDLQTISKGLPRRASKRW